MIRRYNFTDRIDLNKSDVSIKTYKRGDFLYFDASLSLEDYDLPSEAKVFIEPYYRNSYLRYDFGSVSSIKSPEDRSLEQLSVNSNILFRVKIVDLSGNDGLIIGHLKSLSPEKEGDDTENRIPLLHTEFKNLDEEPWRLVIDPFPTLEINNRIPDIQTKIAKDPLFNSLIIPAAFRNVLMELLKQDNSFDIDTEYWTGRWVIFIKEKLLVKDEPDLESDQDQLRWVNKVCNRFCSHNQFITTIYK